MIAGDSRSPKFIEEMNRESDEDSLDDIFEELKSKKKVVDVSKKEECKKKPFQDDMGFTKEGYAKKLKYTEEGYRIYTSEELKLGQGGGTDLCPFDCDCCF